MSGTGPIRRLVRLLLLWLALCAATAAWPASLDVRDISAAPADPVIRWCATSTELTVDQVAAGACELQPLQRADLVRGWDERAFWMRLDLRNDSLEAFERWLEVGYPPMTQVTLYAPRVGGWSVHDVGAATPMARRGPIERAYGVLPVRVEAAGEQVVWVRVASATVISLKTIVWNPDDYRSRLMQRQFWSSLGMGGQVLTLVFALLMLALTRQPAYGFFAMGVLGQCVTLSVPSGLFQRFLWPEAWPITSVVKDMAGLVALYGMYRFLRAFLPDLSRYPVLLRTLRGSIFLSLSLSVVGMLTPYATDRVWFFTTAVAGLSATALCARAWRDGDRASGIILIAFCNLFALAMLRMFSAFSPVPLAREVMLLPALSTFAVSPIILLGLVDRTRQLRDDLLRVQAESAAQLRFLAQMSHELRSPLDNILGNAQLLAREARGAAQTAGINSIFDSGRQLLRIIDHILDYARGAAGMLRLEPAPLRMGAFMRGIERMARLLAVQRNNRFVLELEGDPQALMQQTVRADGERLRQVLGNLLANAARHSGDGVITLRARALQAADGMSRLEFSVGDTGEGIPLQEQERIFRPFERASSKANYAGKGAGLGLAIARQLVELMGGRLTVHSVPGQGATFRFWVPVQRLPDDIPAPAERLEGFDAVGYLGPRRTVLVVDDSEASREVLMGLLESLGFEVVLATGGDSVALLVSRMTRLDLVITDQYMPEGDGWLVLESVGALRPDVPVVMISAAAPTPPANWSGRLRFAAQFLRPLDHAALLSRIGDLLDLQWTESPGSIDAGGSVRAPSPAAGQGEPPAHGMAMPGAKDLQALAQMIELGQVTAIQEWAQHLKAAQPGLAEFADRVVEAVRMLDLQALQELAAGQDQSRG